MSKTNRIAIFVDVQNIYYTTRDAFGRQFDYNKLWATLAGRGDIVIANAYAIHRGDEKQLKFQSALKQIGFNVKLKQFIQRKDGTAKGDWDVGITIDVLECAAQVDSVILLSGDGDFGLLMEHIRNRHSVRTEVFGVPQLTARALSETVDEFHAIDESLLR